MPRFRRLVRTARAFAPHSVLFSAVLQKEMRVAGRRRSTYWLRFFYAGALIGLTALVFMGATQGLQYLPASARLQQLQGVAPRLSYFIVGFQFCALAIAAPILTAGSISDERQKRTLSALATTPLTSGQIVFGKLLAGLVLLVILSLIPLPLLMGVRLFGGLEAEVIVGTSCVNLSVAFLGAALAVWNSTRARRSSSAMFFALLAAAAAQVVPILVYGVTTRFQGGPPSGLLVSTCAPMVLFAVCEPMIAATLGADPTRLWIAASLYNVSLGLGVMLLATATLRRIIRADSGEKTRLLPATSRKRAAAPPPEEAHEPAPAEETTMSSVPDGTAMTPPPSRRKRGRRRSGGASRTVGDLPVLWRELRQSAFGARWKLLAASLAVAGILVWLYVKVGLDEPELHMTIAVIGVLVLLFQAALNTTGGIAGEREARSLPVLMTTALSPREIVMGKYAGTLRKLWFMPAALAAHFAIGLLAGWVHTLFPLLATVIVSGPVLMLSATGLLCSVAVRKATTAAIVNFLFAVGVYLAPWLFLVTIGALFQAFDELEPFLNIPFAFNPVAMTATAGSALEDAAPRHGGRIGDFDFPTDDVGLLAFVGILAAVWVAYAVAAAAALALAARHFRRLAGRE